MRLHRLERVQTLRGPLEDAWRFFSSPHNLPMLTPPWLNLTITGELPDCTVPGLIICYRVTPFFRIPVTWITEITHVEPPRYFVDEQRFGPYRFWHHRHDFREADSGVEMADTVHYGLKYGPFGWLLHSFFVRKRLEAIFDFRQRTIAQMF